MSDTERFNFNIKPGEPGFKELKKNKYGHTVLSHNESDSSDLDDKVTITIDPETGTPRADLSIWDTQQMKDLAQKLNMPLDDIEPAPVAQAIESPPGSHQITDQDMDDLLTNMDEELLEHKSDVQASTQPAVRVAHSTPNQNLQTNDNRIRKVTSNSSEDVCVEQEHQTKKCTASDCQALLPTNAKFCSTCGTLQKINLFCMECGRKFHDREKFCPDCGYARD